MKKITLAIIALLVVNNAYSQNVLNPTGNVGIGTTNPQAALDVGKSLSSGEVGSILSRLSEGTSSGGTFLGIKGYGTVGVDIKSFAIEHTFYGVTNSSINFFRGSNSGNGFITFNTNDNTERMRIYSDGNVGIGVSSPRSKLHMISQGSSLNTVKQFTGDLIIQGDLEGRNVNSGISLECALPANVDGTNPWGQARIITVPNSVLAGASGKLILGTRRLFAKDKVNTDWNYGDDIVIDGEGHVGIGTIDPKDALSVNGAIHSKSVVVETTSFPDYVFKPGYNLISLAEIRKYIKENQHLPEMPSEHEVIKDGINLGEMNKLIVKKVEELTLYLIDKDNELKEQKVLNQSGELRIKKLEQQMELLLSEKGKL